MQTSKQLLAKLTTPEARAERAENWRRRAEIDAAIEAELRADVRGSTIEAELAALVVERSA